MSLAPSLPHGEILPEASFDLLADLGPAPAGGPAGWNPWTDRPVPGPSADRAAIRRAGAAAGSAGRPRPVCQTPESQVVSDFAYDVAAQRWACGRGEALGLAGSELYYPIDVPEEFFPEFATGWEKGNATFWAEYSERQEDAAARFASPAFNDANAWPGGTD